MLLLLFIWCDEDFLGVYFDIEGCDVYWLKLVKFWLVGMVLNDVEIDGDCVLDFVYVILLLLNVDGCWFIVKGNLFEDGVCKLVEGELFWGVCVFWVNENIVFEVLGDCMMDDFLSLGVFMIFFLFELFLVRFIEVWFCREGGCIDVLFEVWGCEFFLLVVDVMGDEDVLLMDVIFCELFVGMEWCRWCKILWIKMKE